MRFHKNIFGQQGRAIELASLNYIGIQKNGLIMYLSCKITTQIIWPGQI